jgi:hypothetical protein
LVLALLAEVVGLDGDVEPSDPLDHIEQLLLRIWGEEILLVIVLEGDVVGDLEHPLTEISEEVRLDEGTCLLLNHPDHHF